MHPLFDIERLLAEGKFHPLPDSFANGSNVNLRICIDGENNAGKTTFAAKIAPMLLMSLQKQELDSKYIRPVLAVEEPPRLFLPDDLRGEGGKKITYRNVAKEHWAVPGQFTEEDLSNPWILANVFFASRRALQEITSWQFPFEEGQGERGLWFYANGEYDFGGLRQVVHSQSDLKKAGGLDVLHIRGSGSTYLFQGSHPVEGQRVRSLMERVYKQGFLAREDLTVIIHPRQQTDRNVRTELSGRLESDLNENVIDEKSGYAGLRGSLPFTKNIVHLQNRHPDRIPSGNSLPQFELTEASVFFILLYLALGQNTSTQDWTLKREKPMDVRFLPKRFFQGSDQMSGFLYHDSLRCVLEELEIMATGGFGNPDILASGDVEIIGANKSGIRMIVHN